MPQLAAWQIVVSLIVSVMAIFISSITLGWTIYRDAIRKPKFRVNMAIKTIHQKGRPKEGPLLFIEALNMGPIPNKISITFAKKSWFKRRLWNRENGFAMEIGRAHV